MDGDASLSYLLCSEDVTSVVGNNELVDENYIEVNDEECVKMLFDREMSFGFKKNESLVLSNCLKNVRLEAITWILNTRAFFGFRFQTAYLSVIYFDRFLSRSSEESSPLKLLSMACLSLAAKMEETEVPALSEFQNEECNFESKVIKRMELSVLSTLEWRMYSITPFDFLPSFITEMSKESPQGQGHFMSKTVQFILAIMREINLMEHRPSVIAAAATLRALDQRLTREALECTINSVSYGGSLEIEDVFTCYDLMQKLEIDHSSSSAAVLTKRKRLTFDKSDSSHDIPDEKRLC